MFDDIWVLICLLNSLVEISFNVIYLGIAVDRRILLHTRLSSFNCCAHIKDLLHIGRIILYSVFGAI